MTQQPNTNQRMQRFFKRCRMAWQSVASPCHFIYLDVSDFACLIRRHVGDGCRRC